MKDIPIIFSAAMVRSLLREVEAPGTGKTMTRRLAWRLANGEPWTEQAEAPSPWQKVNPGDRLWVRENFTVQQVNRVHQFIDGQPGVTLSSCLDYEADGSRAWFSMNDNAALKVLSERKNKADGSAKMSPNIHLPQIASRLTLVITETKIERLQDISDEDAISEGVACPRCRGRGWYLERFADNHSTACADCADKARAMGLTIHLGQFARPDNRTLFRDLWKKLHGSESWDANPEVVALTFTVHKINIDAMERAA